MYKKEQVILRVDNVNLSYDRQILRDVSFEVHNITRPNVQQGQVVSLIGRSGIGKTQLFKILSGLQKPTSGSVFIGSDLHPVAAGEVGIVPQNYILFNHRTILDNLKLGLRGSVTKLTDKEKQELIDKHASKFGLSDQLKKYPMQLSGGQRQRVSIIQQILTGNKFILLDEPFSGLDPVIKDKVVELLVDISLLDEMNTLVIVSHDMENSLAISDTAFILSKQEGHEGATITEKIDLMEMGLSWDPHIKSKREFQDLVAQMKFKM
ncbi:MAG: ABC transporter ATP-binding protein [Bacteroidetes bacterium]|nr:ABC transporter ATP-binding protein [Bacteroidota bacterium]